MGALRSLERQRFGNLVVERRSGRIGTNAAWRCRCDCGEMVVVSSRGLLKGENKSCARNGHNWRPKGLQLRKLAPQEYSTWVSMKNRCRQSAPNAKYYHSKGIKVCEAWWKSFAQFLSDMGPKPTFAHTIERKDGSLGYEPDNCRWATMAEQARNRSSSFFVEYKGERMLMIDAAKKLGLTAPLVRNRLWRGWPLAEALTLPTRQYHRSRKRPPRQIDPAETVS